MLDVNSVRQDFPILQRKVNGKELIYLDNAATTQKPRQVLDRLITFYGSSYSNIHRGVHYLSREATDAHEGARNTVREFINARHSEEIIFTAGTTESINLLAYSLGEMLVSGGDEIIISKMEHHANIVPWQRLCQRSGAVLKVIPPDNNGILTADSLDDLITERTRIISVTHVSNVLGVRNPIRRIIQKAHAGDIPVVVDAAQSVQHIPVDVTDLDCDFLAFSGHKIYGPTGVGVLYGKKRWLDEMPPFHTGGGMIKSVSLEKTEYEDPPQKFEAGTTNIAGAVGLAAAIEYMEEAGVDEIRDHEDRLAASLSGRLSEMEDVTVYADSANKHGTVSFNIEGVHHYDAGMILDGLGVAVRTGAHCAQPLMNHFGIAGTIRASIAMYNNHDDLDRLFEGVRKVSSMMKV